MKILYSYFKLNSDKSLLIYTSLSVIRGFICQYPPTFHFGWADISMARMSLVKPLSIPVITSCKTCSVFTSSC